MDARVALAFVMAIAFSVLNVLDAPDVLVHLTGGARRPLGLLCVALQLSVWIAGLASLSVATPYVRYGVYVDGVWAVAMLLTQYIFKTWPAYTLDPEHELRTLQLDWCSFSRAQVRELAKLDGVAHDASKAHAHHGRQPRRRRWTCATLCREWLDSVRIARNTLQYTSPEMEIPNHKQLMHLTWFVVLAAWAMAGISWNQQTALGSSWRVWLQCAALMVCSMNLVPRAHMNLQSEQIGVVRDVQGASGSVLVVRLSVLNVLGISACTVSDALAVWPDAASVVAYLMCVVVLPTLLSVAYRARCAPKFAGDTCLTRFESIVATWFEQRALCEGAWWTWVFLVAETQWPPALMSQPGPLDAEADGAAVAFAGIGLACFLLAFVGLGKPRELHEECLRGNV